MSLVLKGGRIVNDKITYFSDIKIEDGKIVEIGENLNTENCEVVDVKGSYIIPGGIDTHTHFDLDTGSTITADDFATGTKAAIAGGTTTILDFATQSKGKSLKEGLEEWHQKAKDKAFCDYGFHMAITDWSDSVCDEMDEMVELGVSSFKLYMAYKGSLQVDDSVIYKALEKSKSIGGIIGFHCENGDLVCELIDKLLKENKTSPQYHCESRPPILELEATSRLMKIAEVTKAKVCVVHLSCKESLEEVLKARQRGVDVVVETCPQYLLLDEDKYKLEGFEVAKYVMSPPLRNVENNSILWKALQENQIDTIGTDHCSFNYKGQKELGINDFSKIPNGSPGVEHRIGLLYTYGVSTNKISINKMVEVLSTNPAKEFDIYPQKGTLQVGSDADVTIVDMNIEWEIKKENLHSKSKVTAYDGVKIKGKPTDTIVNGITVMRDGEIEKEIQGKPVLNKK